MTTATFAVVTAGEMGASIGRRLAKGGARVVTSTEGRSAATVARAREAGLISVDDEGLVASDVVLSIAPPAIAIDVARRCAAAMVRSKRSPVYVDCNAVSVETAREIARVIDAAGARFVDGSIIGAPGHPDEPGPTLYLSGEVPEDVERLRHFGVRARSTGGPIGAASALKMAYAGLNKGLTALAAAMTLAASRAGAAEALRQELSESQPALLAKIAASLPDMYAKAYRWDFEMREVARFAGEDPAAERIYEGAAALFERLAIDWAGERTEIAAIDRFLAQVRERSP